MTRIKEYNRLGVIGRFKPLHSGGALLLESVCNSAEHAIIGIGSYGKYNLRNPWTAEESAGMINAYLSPRCSNYELRFIEDYGHIPEFSDGQRWRQEILARYGALDGFVSGDDYVAQLLKNDYRMILPNEIILTERWAWVRGTLVRAEMAKNNDWKQYVPKEVADYIEQNELVSRFRREFGLETLALLAKD